MSMNRRSAMLSLTAAGLAATPFAARSQADWPNKPVKIIVPYPAGGGQDQTARFYADQLRERWGQQILIDNRPGANTIIGAQAALSTGTDAHTLLVTNSTTFVLPYVANAPFDPMEAFTPVFELRIDQLALTMHPTAGISTLAEALEAAKRRPEEFAFGSYGAGTIPHLVSEEINAKRNMKLTHVAYRGTAPLALALVSGEVRFGITDYGAVKGFVETGKLKLLAVTGPRRSPFLPQVPTLTEAGVSGFDTFSWTGLFAPRGTPQAVIERIARDVKEVASSKAMSERFAPMNGLPGNLALAEFTKVVARDAERLGKRSVAAGVRLGA